MASLGSVCLPVLLPLYLPIINIRWWLSFCGPCTIDIERLLVAWPQAMPIAIIIECTAAASGRRSSDIFRHLVGSAPQPESLPASQANVPRRLIWFSESSCPQLPPPALALSSPLSSCPRLTDTDDDDDGDDVNSLCRHLLACGVYASVCVHTYLFMCVQPDVRISIPNCLGPLE